MSSEQSDPYQRAGPVLLLAAMLFLILAFLGGSQPIAPALIVSSLGLFLTGVLLLTFSRGETPDPVVASLLPVQHQINTATLLSRSGCRDPPLFIPFPELDGRVAQFHALPPGSPPCQGTEAAPASHHGRPGILLPPACLPLLKELETRFHLRIPSDPERIAQVIREVTEEILEVAARVVATVEGEEVRVDLLHFSLYPGCREARAASPDACLLSPCTICSLLACLTVRATGREGRIVSMDLDDRSESVHLVFSFRPPVREEPAVASPVVSVSPVPTGPVFPLPVGPVYPVPGGVVAPAVSTPVTPSAETPVTPVPEEPVSVVPDGQEAPAMEAPATPTPVLLVTPVPEEPVPSDMEVEKSQVQEEPEPLVPGEGGASATGEPATPIAGEAVSPAMVGEPEVTVWWSSHPGSRRLRYLRKEDSVIPVLQRPGISVPEEERIRVRGKPETLEPEPQVSPAPEEPGTPEDAERGYLSMEELVARATKDLVSAADAVPEGSVRGEPVSLPLKGPAIPSPEDLKTAYLQKTAPTIQEEEGLSPGPEEPVPRAPVDREDPAAREPVREPGMPDPEKPLLPEEEKPEIPLPKEVPVSPLSETPGSPPARKVQPAKKGRKRKGRKR
jgi:hypothetical protein